MSSSKSGESRPKRDIYLPILLSRLAKRLEQDPQAWPSAAELVAILTRNAHEPIPAVVLAHIEARLDGTARKRRGRKRVAPIHTVREQMICYAFFRYLAWLTSRQKSRGLAGWPAIQEAEWWQGPPSERAARMARRKWDHTIAWETVQKMAYRLGKGLGQSMDAPD